MEGHDNIHEHKTAEHHHHATRGLTQTDAWSELHQGIEEKMQKTIQHLEDSFGKLRTGRLSPVMIEDVRFDYHGTPTPLKQAASLKVADARTLQVEPWDKNALKAIEKALSITGQGYTTSNDGKLIRVHVPVLTEERKKETAKLANQEAEEAKVGIRNIRRDANARIKELAKSLNLGEDEERSQSDQIQRLTDRFSQQIQEMYATKEKDIMDV